MNIDSELKTIIMNFSVILQIWSAPLNVSLDAKMILFVSINVLLPLENKMNYVHAENFAKVNHIFDFRFFFFCLGGCPCTDCEACWDCTSPIECLNKEDEIKVKFS